MMRAHRMGGAGLYVPCGAGSAEACPYGADRHMELENGAALMQYNMIERTGHDWGELQALYPSLFGKCKSLSVVMSGFDASDIGFDNDLEMVIADDYVREQRDIITPMDWSDPEAALVSIAWSIWARSVRMYAAVAGVDDTYTPAEIVAEDLPDACEGIGADWYMERTLELMHDRYAGHYAVGMVEKAIAGNHDLARAVALAIGRAHGDLVPPEDAEPPTAPAIRAFDGRVRNEALEQYPIAANRYADTLREIANALEGAMKSCQGVRAPSGAGDAHARIRPWSEAENEKRKIELTIRELRNAADRMRWNAGMDMGDARNAEQAVSTLMGDMELKCNATYWRNRIGDGRDNDEAFSTALRHCGSAYFILGSTIRRTQGLRGYYGRPVPDTDPITTGNEEDCLKRLSKAPQQRFDLYDSEPPVVPAGECTMFLQTFGVTALRPDGGIETDQLTAIRRSITRRLTTCRYEAMFGRAGRRDSASITDRHGGAINVPGEAVRLTDRLAHLPLLPERLGEPFSEDEHDAAHSRGTMLRTITGDLDQPDRHLMDATKPHRHTEEAKTPSTGHTPEEAQGPTDTPTGGGRE